MGIFAVAVKGSLEERDEVLAQSLCESKQDCWKVAEKTCAKMGSEWKTELQSLAYESSDPAKLSVESREVLVFRLSVKFKCVRSM